jgi:hypothetical protein
MKTTPQKDQLRVRKEYNLAVANFFQQENVADFFTALFIAMTTPRHAVYRSSKVEGKSGWKILRDSITPNFFLGEAVEAIPALRHYVEQHVPKAGCHIVSFSDTAIVLHYDREGKLTAMLASADLF